MTKAVKADMIIGIRNVFMNELLTTKYTLPIIVGDTQMLREVATAQKDAKEVPKTGGCNATKLREYAAVTTSGTSRVAKPIASEVYRLYAMNNWRKTFDYGGINRATAKQYFQMVDIITVTQIIKQDEDAIQLDLVEAYHHLKVKRRLAEKHQFHVQRACVPLNGLTFCLELKINVFLQGDQANSQSDQSEVLRQSGIINGRSTDGIIGKETIRVQYSSVNSIHEGAGKEYIAIQIQSNTNERLSIPWFELEYLFDDNSHSS
ncbi:MAG: hypothetical protein EZS28_038169 [Streblomastix strix]|uniref:Reverse transcriptase domain-containing protein n=1 Tax=Streblomastix strix TaxID=222440 RepID=A0A5J4U7T4_9EUKA|nr:MAG: hypothetical protein EZS28_038169 [Streblomastix strix]